MNWMHGVKLVVCLLPLGLLGACGGGGSSQSDLIEACNNGIQASCNFVVQPVAFAIRPAELTVGDCNTNIPFIFSGGTPPYRVLTTDNQAVPVSAAQQLGSVYYFTASIQGVDQTGSPEDQFTLTVLDNQSNTATTKVNVERGVTTCPDNPLLTASPGSGTARVSEIIAFQFLGGVGPYTFSSSDGNIARAVASDSDSVNVQAFLPGTTLVTITSSDGQRANITFNVIQ